MENKNLLGVVPNTVMDVLTNYVLVKAALFVRETNGERELVLRVMTVREDKFMEIVPVDCWGHPETNGGVMLEITSEGPIEVKSFFSGVCGTRESDYHSLIKRMDGEFVTVLRESEGFYRGKKMAVATVYTANKNLKSAQRIVDALHQPITKVNQCREITAEYDKLPLKWRNIVDTVTFYNNK